VVTTLGCPGWRDNQLKILQWNAGGLNQAKKTELYKTLEDKEIDALCMFEVNVMEGTIKYFHFINYHLNFLPKS
jgi:exonuclease III